MRVHPRLRVGELARVVAQHHAPVLLPQAPRVGLLHAARHVQLRLHRAARHQRRGRQVVAVLVHRSQVVLLRLLCLRLHRLGLRRLLHVGSISSRSTTLVPDHLTILVGDDARGEVVLVVVVHQRILGGDHQRRVARVAVHVVLREEHARIGEVLLLLAGILCHHLHTVAVRVLHHAALGGGVLLRHFLAVLREQGVRLVQLVLSQVLQVITRVAVLHRQRMVIIQTRHHRLHIAVLVGRRLLRGSGSLIRSHRGCRSGVIPSHLHFGFELSVLPLLSVSVSLSAGVLNGIRRSGGIWRRRGCTSLHARRFHARCFVCKIAAVRQRCCLLQQSRDSPNHCLVHHTLHVNFVLVNSLLCPQTVR